jgi:hypothetical protein
MGNYATTTGLQIVLVGTVFDTATTSMVSKMIDWAEDEVNKYISKRYNVSSIISSPPPVIRSLSERLASGYTYRHMARGSKDMIDRAKEIIDPVMENLKGIAEGNIDLLNTSGSIVTEMSNSSFRVLCNTDTYYNTFDEDDPLNWKVDSDKLDDIYDSRE